MLLLTILELLVKKSLNASPVTGGAIKSLASSSPTAAVLLTCLWYTALPVTDPSTIRLAYSFESESNSKVPLMVKSPLIDMESPLSIFKVLVGLISKLLTMASDVMVYVPLPTIALSDPVVLSGAYGVHEVPS